MFQQVTIAHTHRHTSGAIQWGVPMMVCCISLPCVGVDTPKSASFTWVWGLRA